MSVLLKYLDLTKPSLYYSLASITFNPTAWNIVARNGIFFSFAGTGDVVLIFRADDNRIILDFARVQEQDNHEDLREPEKRVLLPCPLDLFGRDATR